MSKIPDLIREGWVIGGVVSVALVVADHAASTRTSPAQLQATGIALSWLGMAAWAMRRPERCASEAIVVGAIVATCAAMSARVAEWTHDQIGAAIDRRTVAALEATATERAPKTDE